MTKRIIASADTELQSAILDFAQARYAEGYILDYHHWAEYDDSSRRFGGHYETRFTHPGNWTLLVKTYPKTEDKPLSIVVYREGFPQ